MIERGRRDELIQNIVDFLHFLQDHQLDPDRVLEQGMAEALEGLSLPPAFQSAYEVMQFMDEMPGGFLIYYAYGKEEIVYANRAVQRMFLCEDMAQFRTLTGNSFHGMVHPEDVEAVEESIRAQIVSSPHDLDYVEYRIIRRDGSVRWLEDYGHFVRSEAVGELFYVFLSESTERRQRQLAEREILRDEKRKGEQQLQALMEKYQQERDRMDREHLRRLEVIRGLGRSYDSIFYVDLERDRILPYLLSERGDHCFTTSWKPVPTLKSWRVICRLGSTQRTGSCFGNPRTRTISSKRSRRIQDSMSTSEYSRKRRSNTCKCASSARRNRDSFLK
ncbi:MAG: PAS domain-containing protein [Ruminiclostridium sp.]|jgi:PAS domain S-box-containing protein|nr:PAS domain-containing protein [Ruminiclostridium sp.]